MHPKTFLLIAALTSGLTAPAAAEDVAVASWNKPLAIQYLNGRAQTWFEFASAERGLGADKITCISCHSMLHFTLARPALRKISGTDQPTPLETRIVDQTKKRVELWQELDTKKYRLYYDSSDQKKKESRGTEAVLNALVLALDDHYHGRQAAGDVTRQAFANLWQVQVADGDLAGSWDWLDFGLEPWESKGARYFGAAVAALAVGTAPGYVASGQGADCDHVALLRGYLRSHLATQNLNNRIWMLWAATKLDGLLTPNERRDLVKAIFQKQQPDGGWNLPSLGLANRSGLPEGVSDTYATGLVLHVLQAARVARNDAKMARGLAWLQSQQTATGAWLAHSVNKKRDPASHVGKFMADAATALAVLALSPVQDDVKVYESGIKWDEPKVVDPGPVGGPPADVRVLFDGKDLSQWRDGDKWILQDGYAIAAKKGITTKETFGDCQLHVEWASPEKVKGSGQGRGNSGVYLMERYEIQILDSYQNKTYFDGQAASIYKQRPPMVNASRKPGEWQSYDILFTVPLFDDKGKLTKPAYVTVLHNGVVVQNHTEILGGTFYDRPPSYTAHPPKGAIHLQFHGDPVRFRNIWIREMKEIGARP